MSRDDRLREALAKIAEVANAALEEGQEGHEGEQGEEYKKNDGHEEGGEPEQTPQPDTPGCTIKTLPKRLLVKAARTAARINPVNAPVFGALAALPDGPPEVSDPLRIAVITSKYWGPKPRRLTVSFTESTPADLKARIISHMNAWTKTGCISFAGTNGTGDVRISREGSGFWSYLGTDIQLIPKNEPTMNLEGFTMSTPEEEYKRVVRHETGHTLGFPHEHMRKAVVDRIDPKKAYKWFVQMYGWDKEMVDAQVLTSLDEASVMGTPPDQDSIMCYQLPGQITKDGKPIVGGTDIDKTDYAFCAKIYPKPAQAHAAQDEPAPEDEESWAASEDVEPTY